MRKEVSRATFIGSSLGLSALAAARPLAGLAAGSPGTTPLRPCASTRTASIRTIVGLRPYRAPGFVLRAESFGSQVLVHNYGHGGGGFSLSWG